MTYDHDALVELRDMVEKMTVEERDRLAERLMDVGASGEVFEWMYRGGWRPLSSRAGDGIIGGELDEIDPNLARRRFVSKKRKG